MAGYRRRETILHPVSLKERLVSDKVYGSDELALEHPDQTPAAYDEIRRDAAGVITYVRVSYPWHADHTQTVTVEYTRE